MNIAACRTYHARKVGESILRMPDGKSVFKIYYVSIIGRDKPEIFEWERCRISKESFENLFLSGGHEGVGFVTAFPHITKIFRFSPHAETVLDVAAFDTDTMRCRELSRGDGSMEFACYAEAVISVEEYHAWANSADVKSYLAFRASSADYPVASNTKMAAYWAMSV